MPAPTTPFLSPSPGRPAAPGPPPAAPADVPILTEIGEFDRPLHVTAPTQDSRLFVVEKGGKVKVIDGGRTHTFLDISEQVSRGYEQGLLSIAFAPDYADRGRAYVNYTDRGGDTRVVEYTVSRDRNRLDAGSRREILSVRQPFSNHNGGLVLFDRAGMMLIGLGDGGSSGDPGNRAQDLDQLLGKLLRIDPSRPSGGKPYLIPGDNPFAARQGARPEIWAYGLRNPWRFSFDEPGNFYLGDVGQNRLEEINFVRPADQAGANYGWPKYEGDRSFKSRSIDESRLVRPVLTYPLSGGNCSVTSAGVYRGSVNSLKGFYLYADFCGGAVKGFKVRDGARVDDRDFNLQASQIASFGEDSAGEMYLASLDGPVYRISKR